MPGLAAAKEALPFARRHPAAATGTGNEAFQLVSLLPLGLGETELDHFFPQPFCQMGRFLADTGYRIVIEADLADSLFRKDIFPFALQGLIDRPDRFFPLFDKTDIGNGPMPYVRINFLYDFIFIHKQIIHIYRVHDGNDNLFILKI